MKIYRWYSEALGMSGVTAACDSATKEDVVAEVEAYIDNTFDDTKMAPQFVDDLMISVWPIEDDDDYNEICPTTLAISY